MGQEVGHAFEDLLEMAIPDVCDRLSSESMVLSPGYGRKIEGISGNIDHYIALNDNGKLIPYILFMEKHSDSSNESEKHLRRHTEEYAQAMRTSVETFGYSATDPMIVVNLIYGMPGGWKGEILDEAKLLLKPTAILFEQEFYYDLLDIIQKCISEVGSPFSRPRIKKRLADYKNDATVIKFIDYICDVITPRLIENTPPDWISAASLDSRNEVAAIIDGNPPIYLRKSMTDLLLIPPGLRLHITDNFTNGEIAKDKIAIKELRLFANIITGSEISGINGIRLEFGRFQNSVIGYLNFLEYLSDCETYFLTKPRANSKDYMAYFDMHTEEFLTCGLPGMTYAKEILEGKGDDAIGFLSQVIPSHSSWFQNVSSRTQNIYLESLMSATSLLAAFSLGTRTDFSNAALSLHGQITISRAQKLRASRIPMSYAEIIVKAVKRFLDINVKDVTRTVKYAEEEIQKLIIWNKADKTESIVVPDMYHWAKTSSLSWLRHNQIHSHPIFNPLSVILARQLDEIYDLSWTKYGFPEIRSINPAKTISGSKDGLDYEFTSMYISQNNLDVHVYETSSVIGLKHTSDKTKELCTRVRMSKRLIRNDINLKYTLIIDGDWREKHIEDLFSAGWDRIYYANNINSIEL
jgi:hypothetical protein